MDIEKVKEKKNWYNDRWLAFQIANGKIQASPEKTEYLKEKFPECFDGTGKPPPKKKNRVNRHNLP